jgi:hypothetical protein
MMLGAELNPIYGYTAPSATWTVNNMVMPCRQIGFETDTLKFKIGDGVTEWNDLPYLASSSSLGDMTLYSCDNKNLIVNVVDQNNTPVVLTGATITWVLLKGTSIILTKTVGAGVTISSSTQFTAALLTSDTAPLSGVYQQQARVTLANGQSAMVLTGTVTIIKGSI